MFDENDNIDIRIRNILSEAQEEVPEHIWKGVSDELDRIEAAKVRKPVLPWLRRTIATVAAAVVAAVILTDRSDIDGNFVPEASESDMIAIAEDSLRNQDTPEDIINVIQAERYVADAGKTVNTDEFTITGTLPQSSEEAEETEETEETFTPSEAVPVKENIYPVMTDEFNMDEDDDRQTEKENQKRKIRTSVVISGITGTNSISSNNSKGVLRHPSISTIHPTTGIKQTKEESSFGLPLSFGVGAKVMFTPRWSVGIGVNYTLLTRKFYGYYTHADPDGNIQVSPSSDIRNSQHYIGVPVNIYYNIVNQEHLNFYVYAGGTAEKCIADKYYVIGSGIVHTEKVTQMQFSAGVGLGVEFILGKHLGLYIDPSLRYYFANHQPKSIRTIQPLMAGFEMGLRVNL